MDEDPSSRLTVRVDDPAWHGLADDIEQRCRRAVEATFQVLAVPRWIASAPIDLLLANDALIRTLNARWRGRDAPTDVLSFPALALDPDAWPPEPPAVASPLGDIVLARETVRGDARAAGKPVADHLSHLVVHGVLHLLGHDHAEDGAAARMEELERQVLAGLGIADPYRILEPEVAR